MAGSSGGVRIPKAKVKGVAAAPAPQGDLDMDEAEGPESKRVRIDAIDDDGDDEDFIGIGFCTFEAAEAERPKKIWHSDERQCIQALGFETETHD